MSARDQFFQYLGIAGGSLIGLFVLQAFVGSYMDISFHADLAALGSHDVVDSARAAEAVQLGGIDEAMGKLGKGRSVDALIVPKASDDVSAMSGWVHHPEFEIYEPAAPAATPVPSSVVAPSAPTALQPAVSPVIPAPVAAKPPAAAIKPPAAAAAKAPAAAAPAATTPTQEHAQ